MKRERSLVPLIATVGVAGVIVGISALFPVHGGKQPSPSHTRAESARVSVSGQSPGSAAVSDVACATDAVPSDSPFTDERARQAAASNPFSSVVQDADRALTREAAIAQARALSEGSIEQVQSAPAAAVQVPYSTASVWTANNNPYIAPSRCVWVVTVYAPFEPHSHPYGIEPPKYAQYTVLFDVASGQYGGVTAGPDIPDVIEGKNLY